MSEELIPEPPRRVNYRTEDVTIPIDGYVLKKDKYWLCEDGDPKKALFFWKTAQCNGDKRILEWSLKHSYKAHDNLQIVFIEFAYTPPVD